MDQVVNRPFWETPWWRGTEEAKARIRAATAAAAAGQIFARSFPIGSPMAASASSTLRCIRFAIAPVWSRSCIRPGSTSPSASGSKASSATASSGCDARVHRRNPATTRSSARTSTASSPAGTAAPSGSSATLRRKRWVSRSRSSFRRTGRTRSVKILTRIRRGERIDHFETIRQRKDGSLIAVSLTVSPVKRCRRQGRRRLEDCAGYHRAEAEVQEQITTLAREAEHRSKNLLANVQATVKLSQRGHPGGPQGGDRGPHQRARDRQLAVR